MKKKIIGSILFVLVFLVVAVNIVTYLWFKQNNSVFEDKCFVYEGNSYYAFGDEEVEGNSIYFTLIDSKNSFSHLDLKNLKGSLQGESGNLPINHIILEKSAESTEYDSYIVICQVTLDDPQAKYSFNTLYIQGVGTFDIGKVIVEKIETNVHEDVNVGYFGFADEKNSYTIDVQDVKTATTFDKIVVKDSEGNEVAGKWLEENELAGDRTVSELHYQYETLNYLYVKPIVYYSCGGKEYVNTAKIATAYQYEISKEEIKEYIRSHLK